MSQELSLDYVENLANLIVPKLETIGRGNGAYVHRANQLITIIRGRLRLAKEIGGSSCELVTCREYVRTAEMWLAEIALEGGEE
jgi:hypothetical protein